MKRSKSTIPLLLASICTLALVACSDYSSVTLSRPHYKPVTAVGQSIARAFEHDQSQPLVALGEYLDAVKTSSQILQKNPNDAHARNDYNFAVGRIVTTISDYKLDPWHQPLRVPAPAGGEYVLTHKLDPRPQRNPALYDFTSADQFDVKGKYVEHRETKTGIGAPVVAVGRTINQSAHRDYSMDKIYYGMTALARFDSANRCYLSFEDPLSTETVTFEGRNHPLAADYTVPLAVMLSREDPKKRELSRLLNPQKYADTARIMRLQPYDPSKQVVLCIHGLKDTPATWTPLLNAMRADPQIRKRYQFWFYSYPSGYPYPYSAAILRDQLDGIEKRYPLNQKMVVIGHSMGGMITRLMLTDSGDTLWKSTIGKSPESLKCSAETRKLVTDSLIFKHRPEVGRAIFIASPHRGSDLASNWMGRLASKLVKSPFTLLKAGAEVLGTITNAQGETVPAKMPNSVDTLSPDNRFVVAVNTLPLTKGVPYHTIMGDRGKGGNKDHTKPISSDGIVPYWSSHLDGAKSELIVPSGHGAHQDPQAIQEVRRILLQSR
jgi:pimeloyl-ACP methyl ester carboxylesterase